MVTYLIRETRPDVNCSRLAVGGGINTPLQLAVFTLGFMEIKGADLDVVFSCGAWLDNQQDLCCLVSNIP